MSPSLSYRSQEELQQLQNQISRILSDFNYSAFISDKNYEISKHLARIVEILESINKEIEEIKSK